ncbi:MAG: hypothetical protein GY927_16620 [bacterium]|nr:hypothetical protein [bacterium]
MKQTVCVFLIALSLYTGASQGQEIASVTTSALNFEINPYRVPILNNKKGFLEKTSIAIGTILKSHHFNNKDYNETHNGLYVSIDKWSIGTYKNSGDVQSAFVTFNPRIYLTKSLKVNLVAGVADGYDGWNYAQGDYLPILGVSAQWMNLRTMLSHNLVAFGLELPLN